MAEAMDQDSMKTPSRNFLRRFDLGTGTGKSPGVCLPATPTMQRLGYGTGVDVYLMNRSPIRLTGEIRSPWAIKLVSKMKEDRKKRKLYLDRLEYEANLLKSLEHPNIIGYRSFSKMEDNRGFLAMEKAGASLSDIMQVKYDSLCRQSGTDESVPQFTAHQMLRVADDIAQALEYLHDQAKILHGDVKSGNVLVFEDFKIVKLADFGVARKLKGNGTIVGKYIGTELWAPLEVIRMQRGLPHEPITAKADIYPYGLLFFEMFSLKPPHLQDADDSMNQSVDEDAFDEMLASIMGTRPPLPELDCDETYETLISLFYCCTDESAEKRPKAKEIAELVREQLKKEVTK